MELPKKVRILSATKAMNLSTVLRIHTAKAKQSNATYVGKILIHGEVFIIARIAITMLVLDVLKSKRSLVGSTARKIIK